MFYRETSTMNSMETKKMLADNLRRLMWDREMRTAADLSRASGVSQSMIGNILRAERHTTTDTLVKLAEALRVNAWVLLCSPELLDAATAPGAADLLRLFGGLDSEGRNTVLSVARGQFAARHLE